MTAILFFVYLTRETMRVVRKTLHPEFKFKKKEKETPIVEAPTIQPIEEKEEEPESIPEPTYTEPKPVEVNFELPKEEKPEEEETPEESSHEGHIEKVVISKPNRKASPETNPDGTLILHFQTSGPLEYKLLCVKLSQSVTLVWAAQANK